MANKHTKRCSLFLIIRKMQIKITMRYLPVRKINIKKSTNNKCWRECREKRTLVHCWWEHKLVHPLWGILGKCLKKLKIQLSCNPAIILLDIYPEKNSNSKRYIHLSVHHCTIYNSQNMEAT